MRNMYVKLEKIWVQMIFYFGGPTKLPWVLHFQFYCVLLVLALTNWNTISWP